MNKYRLVAKKGEGTFSEVLKAQCIKNGKYVAIKCMKNHFDSLDQVNNLREIQALRRLSPHPHIIKLLEVLYDQPTGRLALVFELMDMNIYELIRGRRHYVSEERVRSYMYQLMKALDHMHRNGIFHRDIKPENILIMDDVLKLADFGSCRGIYSKQPYTEYISTRWYRAPECLLTDGYYNYKMDMWGVGCVMFEIVALYPLFPGNNELDQIQKIHTIMGTPPPELLAKLKKRSSHSSSFDFPPCEGSGLSKLLAHVPPDCADLIARLLAHNPDERLSARQALRHPYFRERREADKRAKAAMQPDIAGSSFLCSMDSEHCSHPQQQQVTGAAAAVRRTDSGDLGEPAAAGTDVLAAAVGPSKARQGARGANAAAAQQQQAGVAGVLTDHLAAVASAAAAAVAAAATAAAGGPGKDPAGAEHHGTLPAIGNSSSTRPQQQQPQSYSVQQQPPMLQQQPQQPSQLFMHQQQHRHRQQHAAHNSSLHQGPPLPQQQQQAGLPQHMQASQQQRQQQQQQQQGHAPLEGLQGHQLLGGQLLGSNSLKDRDGSIAQQLIAEASSMSMCQAGHHAPGLALQASVGSLWQEGSGLGMAGPGQMLPPLPGSKTSSSGALQSARRRSHLGQGAAHLQHQPAHHAAKQPQPQPQHHSHPGMGAAQGSSGSSSIKAFGSGAMQQQGSHLASKAGMLQEQHLQGRSSNQGMQISSARYQKQTSKSGMLQPAGSLGSSMSNLSSLQLGASAASKHARGAAGASMNPAVSLSATAVNGGAAAAAGKKPGSQYVSPYGQRR